MNEAGGEPPLLLIPHWEFVILSPPSGHFCVLRGGGEKCSTCFESGPDRRWRRPAWAESGPLWCSCYLCSSLRHRAPWRRGFLEEVAFELNSEGNKVCNGGNERGRKGIPSRMNSMSKGLEAGKHGHMPKGTRSRSC